MAQPGTGIRTVNSVAIEISFHFLQPYVNTTLTQAVASPGMQVVSVASLEAIYPGAQLVIDQGIQPFEEIITVLLVNPATNQITANFTQAHNSGASVVAATFPIQQTTDPFYTQAEVLGYLARAQNEFLARVPAVFALSNQQVAFGQLFQTTPCSTIEINRVAASSTNLALLSLVRAGNNVAATTLSAHGLIVGEKFSILSAADSSFLGAFRVATVPDATHFTYMQVAPDMTSNSGTVGLWLRLYEISQIELTMQNRNWQNEYQATLRNFFEDRTGNYRWGVGGKPASNFPVELLSSVRDSDVLTLTDGFLVPDLFLHGVKYLAMAFMYSKDGEMRNPEMQKYCQMRFDRLVLAAHRWLDNMMSLANRQRQHVST